MTARRFEIDVLHLDDRREALVVRAPRILVGSGVHCDVRVGDVWSPREQILLEAVGDEVVAHARCQDSLPLVDGRPFVHLNVGPETVITASGARIRVRSVLRKEPLLGASTLVRMVTSGMLLSLAIAAPLLAYIVLARPASPVSPAPASVALWDAVPAECRTASPEQAQALATRLRTVGELQREHAPFAVIEGALAVRSLEGAAACFARSGDRAAADRMEIAAAALRAQVDEDYRIHRLRLEHAIETRDEPAVVHELEVLEALTTGRSGPYVEWLRSVERTLTPRSPKGGLALH